MPENPLSKKLQIRPGYRVLALHAPGDFASALSPMPEGSALDHRARGQYDAVLLFAAPLGLGS